MTLGAAMHRTSLEVTNGPAIDGRPDYIRRAQEAEQGSGLLLSALRLEFRHLSILHGITMADAQLFCMNSEAPR